MNAPRYADRIIRPGTLTLTAAAHRYMEFTVTPQPDDSTCGPACLHAMYRYFGDDLSLETVIDEVERLPEGGTLSVHLARHAMSRGYEATIYTCNLQMFDPTWFGAVSVPIQDRLLARMNARVSDAKLNRACAAYIDFLDRGGRILMEDVTPALIDDLLSRGSPVVAGLSATWLYRCARERPDGQPDDVGGEPSGHFVVIHGIDAKRERVRVADPWSRPPHLNEHLYEVDVHRLIGAILLGIVTYDAKLLVIHPASARSVSA